jgi:hypothetical protein
MVKQPQIIRAKRLEDGTVLFNLRLADGVIVNGFSWTPFGYLNIPTRVNKRGMRSKVMVAPGWWYKRLRQQCEREFGADAAINDIT